MKPNPKNPPPFFRQRTNMENYIYDCNHCEATIQAAKEYLSFPCACPVCGNNQIPAPNRKQVSSQNIVKSTGCGLGISLLVTLLIGGLFSGILPLLLGALLAFAMIVVPAWILTNLGADLLFRSQQGYKVYRKNGGSPFWDNFLMNKTEYYVLPSPEPDYRDFTPPGKWKYQCLNCNARVDCVSPCWNCGVDLVFSNEQRAEDWLS